MPQIPYVRSGEKLHITAKTLNTVAEHINGAVTISAGKPIKGGGGSSVVADNTPDIFKIHFNSVGGIYITGGVLYHGENFYRFNNYVYVITSTSIIPQHFVNDPTVDNVLFHYITAYCQLSSGVYQVFYEWGSAGYFMADVSPVYYYQTIAKSTWRYDTETQLYKAVGIEQYVYPTNIVVNNRWS
jgi:hypothetical protein